MQKITESLKNKISWEEKAVLIYARLLGVKFEFIHPIIPQNNKSGAALSMVQMSIYSGR